MKQVRVFLRTPLHRGRSTGARKYELNETVTEIVGMAEPRDGGLEIQIGMLYTDKGEPVESPWVCIFLPMSKIEAYVIE